MKNKSMFKTPLLALALASVTSAYAVPTLTLFDGTTTVVIEDGSAGDTSATPGIVTYEGAVGQWSVTANTGFTKPVFGGPTQPYMDLKFGAGNQRPTNTTLTIDFSEDGWNFSGGMIDAWGGTTPGTVINQLLVNGQVVVTQGPFTPGTPNNFSSAANAGVTLTPTDVLTLRVIVSHSGTGLTTGNKNVRTPDGGSTVALLGLALGGVAAARRKFRI